MKENLVKATQLKEKLSEYRPLSNVEVNRLKEFDRIQEVFNSNALEGNTITEYETKLILEEGITVAEKPLKEHLEIINLNEAIDYIEDLVRTDQVLTENMIKDIHRIVLEKTRDDKKDIGGYRRVPVEITGSKHTPPDPISVPEEMDNLIKWSKENKNKLHPIEYATYLHEKFVTIHPFIDGNGRTGRLLMNFALTKQGYPPIVIKSDVESRVAYNKSLEYSNTHNDIQPFLEIVTKLTLDKLEKMVKTLDYANNYEKLVNEKKNNDLERWTLNVDLQII